MLQAKKQGVAAGDEVQRFYKSRNFLAAWSGNAENDEMGREIRAVLARAHEQGLRDENYKSSQEDLPLPAGAKAAEYEVALTDALLRYSHDVRNGRVRPADIYNDVLLPAPPFDAAAALTTALKNHSVMELSSRTLRLLIPSIASSHELWRVIVRLPMTGAGHPLPGRDADPSSRERDPRTEPARKTPSV